MFYAPWCPHCKKIKPEFSQVAKEINTEKKVTNLTERVQTLLSVENECEPSYKVFVTSCLLSSVCRLVTVSLCLSLFIMAPA